MSEDRSPRLEEQLTETVSNKLEAIFGGPEQAFDKKAAEAAQKIGLEVDIDAELQNLALPKPVLQLIEDPLKAEGFSIGDDDLHLDHRNPRKVTRLVGTESGEHYLLHIKYFILTQLQYYNDVVALGQSFPSGSRVCLFSQDGDGIHVYYSTIFDDLWPRLFVKAVYLPWQQLLDISKDVEADARGRFLLDRMGMKHLTGLKSANGNQEKAPNLENCLGRWFNVKSLDRFLSENQRLKKVHTKVSDQSPIGFYCRDVVYWLKEFELIDEDFFEDLRKERPDNAADILRLREEYRKD